MSNLTAKIAGAILLERCPEAENEYQAVLAFEEELCTRLRMYRECGVKVPADKVELYHVIQRIKEYWYKAGIRKQETGNMEVDNG